MLRFREYILRLLVQKTSVLAELFFRFYSYDLEGKTTVADSSAEAKHRLMGKETYDLGPWKEKIWEKWTLVFLFLFSSSRFLLACAA